MTIHINQSIPNISLKQATSTGPIDITTHQIFQNKRTVLFGLPGAFTPLCSARHLPEFAQNISALNDAGIDQIVCLSVNDAFVMNAWAQQLNIHDHVIMLCDGNGELTEKLGLSIDLTAHGMGIRSQRYAMIIDNNIIVHYECEESIGTCSVSSAAHIIDVARNLKHAA